MCRGEGSGLRTCAPELVHAHDAVSSRWPGATTQRELRLMMAGKRGCYTLPRRWCTFRCQWSDVWPPWGNSRTRIIDWSLLHLDFLRTWVAHTTAGHTQRTTAMSASRRAHPVAPTNVAIQFGRGMFACSPNGVSPSIVFLTSLAHYGGRERGWLLQDPSPKEVDEDIVVGLKREHHWLGRWNHEAGDRIQNIVLSMRR